MSKQVYKAVILDLDGTTVATNGHSLPSQRVVDTVQKAQAQGVAVAIATGRPLQHAQHVTSALGLTGASIFSNGSEIIDVVSSEIIYHKLLSVAALRELITICRPFGYKLYTNSSQYGKAVADASQISAPAAKLFVEAVKEDDAIHMLEVLAAVQGVEAHPTTSWSPGKVLDLHVTDEHATKRYGVERLIKMLGLKKAEVMAIGDGYNDLPMMQAAGLKVAMGNSPDEIKAVVDYVAPSLEEDGVSEAIERFVL